MNSCELVSDVFCHVWGKMWDLCLGLRFLCLVVWTLTFDVFGLGLCSVLGDLCECVLALAFQGPSAGESACHDS